MKTFVPTWNASIDPAAQATTAGTPPKIRTNLERVQTGVDAAKARGDIRASCPHRTVGWPKATHYRHRSTARVS